MVVFWLNDPSVLFNVNSIKDFWPNNEMSKNKKFNAITRLLLLIIVTFYISNRCIKFLCIGVTTLAMVTLVYYINIKDREYFTNKKCECKENMNATQSTVNNPMSNLLLPEIKDNPNKKQSEKAFGCKNTTKIEENVKDMICNVSFKDENQDEIKKKLFSNVGDNFNLDRSMTQFYAVSDNTVSNDREEFQNWLYGNMPSCKDQDPIACLKKSFRHIPDR